MEKLFGNCLLFFIIFLTILQLYAKRDYTIEVKELLIKVHDEVLITSVHYSIYDQKVIYLDFTVSENVTDFDMKVTFDMVKKDNRNMNIINMSMNGCDKLESSHDKMNFLKVIFREIFRVSNVPKKCPIYANTKYAIRNYTINNDDYPPIFPIMQWQLKVDMSIKEQLKVAAIINGRIRKL